MSSRPCASVRIRISWCIPGMDHEGNQGADGPQGAGGIPQIPGYADTLDTVIFRLNRRKCQQSDDTALCRNAEDKTVGEKKKGEPYGKETETNAYS